MPDLAHDHTHVNAEEADGAILDSSEELPAPALPEPVVIGAGVGLVAVVTTLIAAGVPWYGAVGLVGVLVLVAAWQRGKVTPHR